jgi:hypothetical protein
MNVINTGARFKRKDGTWIERNQVFDATQAEVNQRAYKLKPTVDAPTRVAETPVQPISQSQESPAADTVSASVTTVDPEAAENAMPVWPLQMTPQVYAKLHPEGQHAELARRIIEDGNGTYVAEG